MLLAYVCPLSNQTRFHLRAVEVDFLATRRLTDALAAGFCTREAEAAVFVFLTEAATALLGAIFLFAAICTKNLVCGLGVLASDALPDVPFYIANQYSGTVNSTN